MSDNNLLENLFVKRGEVATLKMRLKSRELTQTHLCKQARREVARILTQINKAK